MHHKCVERLDLILEQYQKDLAAVKMMTCDSWIEILLIEAAISCLSFGQVVKAFYWTEVTKG